MTSDKPKTTVAAGWRVAIAGALTYAAAVTWSVGAVAAQPHAAIQPYPDAQLVRREDRGFADYNLVVAIDPEKKQDAERFETLTVSGSVTFMSLENPRGRSHTEISANYQEALEAAGYTVLFQCADDACGASSWRSSWQRVTGMRYFPPQKHYLAARAEVDGQQVYVAYVIASRRHQIVVVEAGEMETGLVTAQALTEGLAVDGRVVLDGLYFDHDRAELLPSSDDALDVIARYLAEQADLSVYIVGHTDGTGGFGYNMNLARSRANSVVEALVERFQIDRNRLEAHGVGPLAPTLSNRRDLGRQQNRRVEMVERL